MSQTRELPLTLFQVTASSGPYGVVQIHSALTGPISVTVPAEDVREIDRALTSSLAAGPTLRDLWRETLGTFDGQTLEVFLEFSHEGISARMVVLSDGLPVSLRVPVGDALIMAMRFRCAIWGVGSAARSAEAQGESPQTEPRTRWSHGWFERALAGLGQGALHLVRLARD